ncbi:hypothetical protein BTR23_06880 [Alkalihalophilus pseudofirmus]|uniref:DUF948 domain-containing protein n=1 Tax=Alkalihalobacterium alkalinitrilicum TaxID=427920 RepID=UPI00094D6F74|nr:DUF948 domain-containing protein [Alkalihalobacterium alkalinitrilicum]OLO40214.1 hypothetical protein BTR23_06880 [Alkalihalophilus pseudofirmus]
MIIVYISVAVVAVAFFILVLYLVQTLKSATKTLNNVADTVSSLEKQLQGVTKETEFLLQKTNRLADDIHEKSQSLNTMFDSVKDLGQSVQTVNDSLKKVSNTVARQSEQQSAQVAQAVQWGNAAIDLYSKWKEKKQQHPNDVNS